LKLFINALILLASLAVVGIKAAGMFWLPADGTNLGVTTFDRYGIRAIINSFKVE
jgi:hypothetical protein